VHAGDIEDGIGPGASTRTLTTHRVRHRRAIAQKVLDSFHSCPIPEVARLGRTLRAWSNQIHTYFDTHGVSNGGTEAINLIIEESAG
jgi:transposase